MGDDHDDRIAGGLQSGQAARDAWTALYDMYFDRVWELVGRMIGPRPAAVADVVQETFLAAARSARSYDRQRGSLWLWLAGIARNQVGAYWRARHRELRLNPGGDLHPALADLWAGQAAPNPAAVALSAEQADLVRAALLGLPDDYQAILQARYWDDAPLERIARERGATVEAARSKLARARQAFREAFKGASPESGARHE